MCDYQSISRMVCIGPHGPLTRSTDPTPTDHDPRYQLLPRFRKTCPSIPPAQFAPERWKGAAPAALHLQHLKKLVGLRQSVPTPILLSELRLSQMSYVSLLRASGFWNSMVASPGVHQQIALDAGQVDVSGVRSRFVAGLLASLRAFVHDMSLVAGSLLDFDVTQLRCSNTPQNS